MNSTLVKKLVYYGKKHLGLNDLYYEELGNSIDAVINSAAIVKHYGNRDTFNATKSGSGKYL